MVRGAGALMRARGAGTASCVATGNTGTNESCGSLLGLLGRKSCRRSVATRARNPDASDPISARPRSVSGPRVVFENPPEMGRTRMGFSAGATPLVVRRSNPRAHLHPAIGGKPHEQVPERGKPRPRCRLLPRNPFEYGPFQALFELSWTPAFAGVTEVENPCETGRCRRFLEAVLGPRDGAGPDAEVVAGDEALIASRRIPSVKFAIIEPSKEAHDSLVPVFQCRRTRRPRRREPPQRPAPRATPTRPARLLRLTSKRIGASQ